MVSCISSKRWPRTLSLGRGLRHGFSHQHTQRCVHNVHRARDCGGQFRSGHCGHLCCQQCRLHRGASRLHLHFRNHGFRCARQRYGRSQCHGAVHSNRRKRPIEQGRHLDGLLFRGFLRLSFPDHNGKRCRNYLFRAIDAASKRAPSHGHGRLNYKFRGIRIHHGDRACHRRFDDTSKRANAFGKESAVHCYGEE